MWTAFNSSSAFPAQAHLLTCILSYWQFFLLIDALIFFSDACSVVICALITPLFNGFSVPGPLFQGDYDFF